MKKFLIFVFLILAVALIFFALQGNFSQTPPSPSTAPAVSLVPNTEPSATPEPEETIHTPEHTPDPRNEEPVIRAEIAKMLQDAEELIKEDLIDDAGMILRDLKTRDLTDAEKEQVAILQAKITAANN